MPRGRGVARRHCDVKRGVPLRVDGVYFRPARDEQRRASVEREVRGRDRAQVQRGAECVRIDGVRTRPEVEEKPQGVLGGRRMLQSVEQERRRGTTRDVVLGVRQRYRQLGTGHR